MVSIMIVEDEFLVRAGLRTCIDWEEEGFEIVAEAQNGEEALAKYEKFHPAIIITDIRLPKLDGLAMMRKLREQKEDVGFVVVSAYDDFHYAKEAISIGVENYFLKGDLNPGELLKTLRKLSSRYRLEEKQSEEIWPKTMQELYAKSGLDEQQAVDWKEKMDGVYLLYFRMKGSRPEMLEAMVSDFFSRNDMSCWKVDSDNGSWFMCEKGEDEEGVLDDLIHMFRRYVDEKIIIVKTDEVSKYSDLKEAIYHALLLYEYESGSQADRADADKEDEKKKMQHIYDIIHEMAGSIKYQKLDESLELLKKMEASVIASRLPSALFMGVYRLVGILAEYDVTMLAVREYEKLLELMDVRQIFQTLADFVKRILEEKEENTNIYILKVKEYVEKNYQKPIRIKELSDYIHVSPNYLGRIFYVNTGIYLKDYINSVKMEKARELLSFRKYQVSEVAEMVGMEDQRYFSKVFKKTFGVSPKEYEKNTQ